MTDFPMLRDLDEQERRRFVAAGAPRRFAAREVVFHEGDPGDTLHLVVSGRLAVRVATANGVLRALAGRGVVALRRGRIAVTDRVALDRAAR